MRFIGLGNIKKIYFIGVGGISMSALAQFLQDCGYEVSGSDGFKGDQIKKLSDKGITVDIGVDGERPALNVADAVVYTDAISLENAELLSAQKMRKQIYSRAELLSIICSDFPNVIAVAGSHGKTTCTSMCAHIFRHRTGLLYGL